MANPMLCSPNYIDNTFSSVVIGGGAWTLPPENLKNEAFGKVCQSATAAANDTRFDVDLGQLRGIQAFAFPYHNLRLSGQYRARGSSVIKWQGATVASNASLGASSMVFQAGATAVNVAAGEIFKIAGDSTIYKATNTIAIAAGGTGSVSISPVLTAAATSTTAITCNSGDFSAPEIDTGQIDAFSVIYPFGSIDYTHPSWWTGLPTEEQRQNEKFPIVKVFPLTVTRYWRFEFFDTTNPDGFVRFPRLFLVPGYQASIGIGYGAEHGFTTDTQVETALGGRRIYSRQPTVRTLRFGLPYLSADEAYSNVFDLIRDVGIDKQLFFIFDPADVELMHRRAFAATLSQLTPLQYPYYDNISAAFELREVVA